MLMLKLFGPGEAHYHNRPIDGFPTKQPATLLCYMAIRRHVLVRREQLADTFWPQDSGVRSRKKLSQTLWRLRRSFRQINASFEQFVIADTETLSFLKSDQYWLDIEAFENMVSACKHIAASDLEPSQAAQLAQAAQLYTGDLLESFDYEWCLNQRVFLSDLYYKTLKKLMDYHIAHESYDLAIDYGQQLLTCDNTHEHIHQDIMRLYWMIGDRNAALGQYNLCVQILNDEFDASPMAQTEYLYHQVNQGSYDPSYHEPLVQGLIEPAVGVVLSPRDQMVVLLQKMRRLKVMADETRLEIQQIEQVLERLIPESS